MSRTQDTRDQRYWGRREMAEYLIKNGYLNPDRLSMAIEAEFQRMEELRTAISESLAKSKRHT